MSRIGGINAIVSPISIPPERTLPVHIKKGAFLVHITDKMPLIFDGEETLDVFLRPLFQMQELGSKNNVLIPNVGEQQRLAVLDAMLIWQMFGGISLSSASLDSALKVLNDMLTAELPGKSGDVDVMSLSNFFNNEREQKGIVK